MTKKLYIIGGGIAGLSAAIYALDKKYDVELFEAAPYFGGRCRSFFDKHLGCGIDNGNHLILGANKNAIALIKKIGAKDELHITKNPKIKFTDVKSQEIFYIKGKNLTIPNTSQFNAVKALFSLISSTKDETVKQSVGKNPLYKKLLEPLCITILNTPANEASSKIFAKVLLKILFGGRNSMTSYLPKNSWNESLISPMIQYIENKGGKLHRNTSLSKIISTDGLIESLLFKGGQKRIIEFSDKIILALPPYAINNFLPDIKIPKQHQPIVNVHFLYGSKKENIYEAILNGTAEWLFFKNGMISTTTSAASDLTSQSDEKIATRIWNDIQKALNISDKIPKYRVIKEKRATFSCSPEIAFNRPVNKTNFYNLFLAGDYTNTFLPATIESAIVSAKKSTQYLE